MTHLGYHFFIQHYYILAMYVVCGVQFSRDGGEICCVKTFTSQEIHRMTCGFVCVRVYMLIIF